MGRTPMSDAREPAGHQSGRESGEAESEDFALEAFLRHVAHAPPRRPPHSLEGRLGVEMGTGGRYRIERCLGKGGMGAVYLASDALLGRQVALKVINRSEDEDDTTDRMRLLREARSAACVEHERVARVYDVGEHEGALFVAMEYVRGATMRQWTQGRIATSAEIVHLAMQIAEGLEALHARGIIHRDLKPENVMLSETGGVKLLDFGLAKRSPRLGPASVPGGTPAEPATLGPLFGTPGYMPPEQWQGQPVDARGDVFAFGVMMYELVTGGRPFGGATLVDVMTRTLAGTPAFAPEAWDRVPPGLLLVTARALLREPTARYADAHALADALREHFPPSSPRGSSASSLPPATLDLPHAPTSPVPAFALPSPVIADEPSSAAAATPRVHAPPRRKGPLVVGGVGAAAIAMTALVFSVRARSPAAPTAPDGMVRIDGGAVRIGLAPGEEEAACSVLHAPCPRDVLAREMPSEVRTVAPFFLDALEVTNASFAATLSTWGPLVHVEADKDDHRPRFVRWAEPGKGHDDELLVDLAADASGIELAPDKSFRAKTGSERRPVVAVSFLAAKMYCESRGRRLPTEDEWETAARGAASRRFPWGDALPTCDGVAVPKDAALRLEGESSCARALTGPVGVGASTGDVTPDGVHDLGGNVAEWVDTPFAEGPRTARTAEPSAAAVVRGGSFEESFFARTSARTRWLRANVANNLGFRCAASAAP